MGRTSEGLARVNEAIARELDEHEHFHSLEDAARCLEEGAQLDSCIEHMLAHGFFETEADARATLLSMDPDDLSEDQRSCIDAYTYVWLVAVSEAERERGRRT